MRLAQIPQSIGISGEVFGTWSGGDIGGIVADGVRNDQRKDFGTFSAGSRMRADRLSPVKRVCGQH